MNWYLAVETEDLFVFVNRVTGEVIVWEVDNARLEGELMDLTRENRQVEQKIEDLQKQLALRAI